MGAIYGAVCAIDPTVPETQVSSDEQLDTMFASKAHTIAAQLEIMNMDNSFDDPGGVAKTTGMPDENGHALHGPNDKSQEKPAAQLINTVVKCNDEGLQSVCSRAPYNIRCAEGCNPNSICSIIMDHPHMLCESECTCIAGDETTIPTFNEFAELE